MRANLLIKPGVLQITQIKTSKPSAGHEHIVIVLRGAGKVSLSHRSHAVHFLDVVFITSNTPHQFINTSDEPFGFLCIVSAKRDRPTELCCE
jgi:quercetin dioxygenase-like cupin family protein